MTRNRYGSNQRGEIILGTFAIWLLILLGAIFIPNQASKAIGIQNKENKIVQTEKVDLIKNADGTVIGTKTTTSNSDLQQHVTFLEWLQSLPILVLILMGLGAIFPPVALFLHTAWSTLKTDTQKIVLSVDKGLAVLKAKDPALHQAVLNEMSDTQKTPSSAEVVVNKAQIGKL